MERETIINNLNDYGYCIIPNVLNKSEIDHALNLMKEWQKTIPNHDEVHRKINPHFIYKYHQVGHTRHAWYLRTRKSIQDIFRLIWNTNELIVSFDGCSYMPNRIKTKDKCWIHTDQAPNKKGLECYQGLISLTDNKEKTLVVHEGSHNLHEKYFTEKNISSSKNWHKIDIEYLKAIQDKKKILHVPAGALVLWDSRTFHQNQYGNPKSNEERFVQYVCYLPKNHIKNDEMMKSKRKTYFQERRTSTHWPVPINVVSLQPQNYGDTSFNIDYKKVKPSNLDDLMEEIEKLI